MVGFSYIAQSLWTTGVNLGQIPYVPILGGEEEKMREMIDHIGLGKNWDKTWVDQPKNFGKIFLKKNSLKGGAPPTPFRLGFAG